MAIADLERRLADSEARHRLLTGSWAQAEWETDADGVVVADSPSWRAYTGQTLKEWLGHGWLDAIHPDDRIYAEKQWREAITAHTPVDAEFRLRTPNGGWRWTNVRAAPVLDAGGDIERWVGINIDIDGRKRAEAAQRESADKYRTLFESLDEAICFIELIEADNGDVTDFRHTDVNEAHGRLTGLGNVAGKLGSEVVPGMERSWFKLYEDVARTGEARRIENYNQDTGRWYNTFASRVGGTGSRLICIVAQEVTERKEREERQAFLLALGDAMRSESTASDKIKVAARLLGEKLDASRILYAEYDWNRGVAHIFNGWFADGAQPFPAVMRLEDYDGEVLNELRAGQTVRVDNVGLLADEPGFAAIAEVGVQALLSPPLMIDGKLAMNVSVHQHDPRHWTDNEVALVQEVAERLWAEVVRARAEAALRESEERFRQFAEASASGLWIRDADALAMEYISRAVPAIYGVEREAFPSDLKQWAALIVPEDRETALEHIERARQGELAVHEFRIQRRSDQAFRWIRNTDFPLLDAQGHVERIGGIVEDVTEAKLAVEHQGVLLAELQHRVRNIMALLRSITSRTAEGATSVSEYQDLMMGRLLAFARVQALLTRTANVSVGIATIVNDEVSVQARHEAQYVLDGPDVALSPKAAEVLTLAIHELATNAVKYGALCVPDGRIRVRWSTFEKRDGPWLAFDWSEEGAPAAPAPAPDAPRRRGFGSELIEARIPYELKGRGQVTIEPSGARCHLEFPLHGGASILETGAPQRATVFGGAIDMTGEPDLSHRRVLVVEDDYYLATDTARALRGAGAEVLGPCAGEEDARAQLEEERPDAVVLDINLGSGVSFKLAETLKDRGIPFVFTTGYDAGVIPAEFAGVERLQKPFQLRQIVGAVATLTTDA